MSFLDTSLSNVHPKTTHDPAIFLLRPEHGGHPLRIQQTDSGPIYVLEQGLDSHSFQSPQQLLDHIYQKPTTLSLEQYLYQDVYHDIITVADPPEPIISDLFFDLWVGTWGVSWAPMKLGIDLETRSHEVRKLLFKGFGGHMSHRGYDPEEVLQEIYQGIVVRNRGTCPWDPRKSTFGHYVFMVISCVLYNYHRKEMARQSRLTEVDNIETIQTCDLSQNDEEGYVQAGRSLSSFLDKYKDDPHYVSASRILPYLVQGHSQDYIVKVLDLSKSKVSRAVVWIREKTALWANRKPASK